MYSVSAMMTSSNGKHFPRYWPFVRGIHRSPVNSPHKGQWRGALMFSLINVWINGWVNNGEAGDLRRHRAHYDVTVMCLDVQCDSNGKLSTSWWSYFIFNSNSMAIAYWALNHNQSRCQTISKGLKFHIHLCKCTFTLAHCTCMTVFWCGLPLTFRVAISNQGATLKIRIYVSRIN